MNILKSKPDCINDAVVTEAIDFLHLLKANDSVTDEVIRCRAEFDMPWDEIDRKLGLKKGESFNIYQAEEEVIANIIFVLVSDKDTELSEQSALFNTDDVLYKIEEMKIKQYDKRKKIVYNKREKERVYMPLFS